MSKQDWLCRFVGAASGLLLMTPNLYPVWAPLQVFALVGVLYLAASRKISFREMLLAGIYMGLAYTLPQFIALRLPAAITLTLLTYFMILMTIFALVSPKLLNTRPVYGAFAVGAFLVVLDWVNFTAVPIWGTAQSFTRCWSSYPNLIQFVSLTGITGIIFVLGTLQALAVNFIVHPEFRARLFTAAAAVLLIFMTANIIVLFEQPTGKIKVAAIGWTSGDSARLGEVYTQKGFDALFAVPAAQAAGQGAKLIVCPEMAFTFTEYNRQEWLERFGQIAHSHNVFLVIGYFDATENKNQLFFMNPQGKVLAEYTKTHLVPYSDFRKGDGRLSVIDINGVRVGGMICQDDNFTRLSRQYNRKRVAVVAVPTLDWLQVKDAHLQNSIHRAIESRYAVVRASLNGISAIICPTGKVTAYCDHFVEGPRVIIAEVPVYEGRTLFGLVGHWPVALSFVFLIVYVGSTSVINRRKPTICPSKKD